MKFIVNFNGICLTGFSLCQFISMKIKCYFITFIHENEKKNKKKTHE